MPDLTPVQLPLLQSHRIPGLDLEGDFLFPDYSGRSLLNLVASACAVLSAPLEGRVPLVEDVLPLGGRKYRRVVLLVLDGLGLYSFQRFLRSSPTVWSELLPRASLAPITSLAPSTTSAVLTTLWTGAGPLEHGVIGYELWLREYGMVANMIVHAAASAAADPGGLKRSGFVPQSFIPVPPLGIHFSQQGVAAHAFMPVGLARSGLSTMHLEQAQVYPYRTTADLWISLADFVERPGREREYVYVYWPDLDTLSHSFGPQDPRVQAEFDLFSRAAEKLFFDRLGRDGLRDTLFLLTADHGLIATTPSPEYELKRHPRLAEMLHMQPTGETRLAYLYPRPGREDAVQTYMKQAWPDEFAFLPSANAAAAGLFGPGSPSALISSRLGDLVAAARGNSYLWWVNKENHLFGRHGGLSPEEMLVPLFALGE